MASTQQQQQKPPALDWLSFPAPAVVDAPHPDLFDFELDNSLSAFDQAQVQLLTLDYNDSFAFTNYRSETPQGPPSVITASSESAYETLSSYSESLNNYSNSSPGYNAVEHNYPVDLNIDFGKFTVDTNDLNSTNLALMDPTRDAPAYSGLQYDRSGQVYDAGYDVSATRSTYSASSGYVPVPGSSTVAPSHIVNSSVHAANSESPKSSSDGGHAHNNSDGDPRKKYACPNCTRCMFSPPIITVSTLTVPIYHSLRTRVQPQDAPSNARPPAPEALRLPSPLVRAVLQPQARSRSPSRQHPPRRDGQPVLRCLRPQRDVWPHRGAVRARRRHQR